MKQNNKRHSRLIAVVTCVLVCTVTQAGQKPNVVFVLTDDQGYGDLSCHGNPMLKTPNLDKMYEQSVRFTDFHVSPLCTPTRGALLTGRDPGRNGAYRTSAGRSILHTEERTLGNLFADNGYATGMFGKWHLGDNAPHRPQDYGFQDVVWHRCGGIGQVSAEMQGDSFRQLVAGQTNTWRDAVYYTYYEFPSVHMVKRHYGVATERYKLMHFYYDIDEWEMYDLKTDPSEMKNVYGNPAYADAQKMMHKKLDDLRRHYGDSDENDQKFLKAYLDHQKKK